MGGAAPRIVAAAILLFLLGPGAARAQGVRLQASQEMEIWHDTDVDETVADQRLDLYLAYEAFAFQTTFLIHQPTDAARLDPNLYGDPFQGVRKKMLEAHLGPARIQVGNVYSTLARGVALRVVEDQTVDFDNGVDGFRGLWEEDAFQVEVLAGRNAYGEVQTYLKAGSLRWSPLSGLGLGLHAIQVDSTKDAAGRPRSRDRVWGGEASAQGSWWDVYATYMIRDVHPPDGQAPPVGHGAYGAASLYLGPLTVSVEGKDFRRYRWAYAIPPPAVRQHATTLLNRGSHVANFNPDDERGYLLEMIGTFLDGSVEATLHRSASETHDGRLPFFENYAELQASTSGGLYLTLRADETEETVDEGARRVFFERITWGGNAFVPLGGGWSVEADLETQALQEQDLAQASYTFPHRSRTTILTLNLYRAPTWAFAVTQEWTDDDREPKNRWTFVEMNVQLLDRHQVGVGFGAFRGGQLCSGGICRPVEPFTGLRLTWQTTF
jgi:hypothetical protein